MTLMGGKVILEWLQTADPNLKIQLTSGYTDDARSPHGSLEPGVEFLPKPCAPATRVRKLRAMLLGPIKKSEH
jgi:hypothetical protein